MEYEYKDYYFYSNIDSKREPLGECRAGNIGIATYHFASSKCLDIKEFIKIYSVGAKNEHK
jgi:hypothetical protein